MQLSLIKEEDIPKEIKDFTFVRALGEGSYGVVCLYKRDDELFAIKLESFEKGSLTKEQLILRKLN